MLPIMQIDGRNHALAGMISDGSLVDVLTVTNRDPAMNNGVGFRAGTVVVVDSVLGDNFRGFSPATMDVIQGRTCGVAVFTHYDMDRFANSNIMINDVLKQRPCNVATTCRAWLLCDPTGISANDPVQVTAYKADGTNLLSGCVKKGTAGARIPGWFFTGRKMKDANGFQVAEVNVRPQTAAAAALVPVTGVTITEPDQSLAAGAKFTFHAVVAPANASNAVVKWSSGATGVATVNANTGEVTAASGATTGQTATITATTDDGAKTASRVVTIS